jgi:hypothetical protein
MFNGDEFRQFAEHMGFKHRKITPLWPRANSECEKNYEESGYLEYSFITTSMYCPFGYGPHKYLILSIHYPVILTYVKVQNSVFGVDA